MTAEESRVLLEGFNQAWNAHDVDAMMSFMADDCVFVASAGPGRDGQRHVGRDAVRKAYLAVLGEMPDARWHAHEVFVVGRTAFSLWTLTGTTPDGAPVEVDGIDHFEIEAGRIKTKNAFRKARRSAGQDVLQAAARP
jgi:uncharacterized protein (TIGR02246 family)